MGTSVVDASVSRKRNRHPLHTDAGFSFDIRLRCSLKPPQISAVVNKNCDSSGRKCAEVVVTDASGNITDRPQDGKFSVNDQTAGNVVGEGGVLRTTLKFFAWADPNHMPIRHMIVDFGDGIGKYDATGGPYPNRRGYRDAQLKDSYCDNSNFGQSSDACTARPISIEHTYQCERNGNGWDQTENRGDGACVFRPRVYVEDNWGYCTGTCPGDPAGTSVSRRENVILIVPVP